MGCTNSTAKAPRANKDQKYITKNASDDWSDDEAPNLLQQTSKIENQHRRRLSVSTVDGGLPKAVLQSQIQKSIEIHKAKQQDTSPCMEAPGCGSPSRRTSITSFQDPAMQLVDRSRNMIKDVTLRMLHDLFPEAEHYAIFGSPARSVQRGFDSKVEVVDGVMPSDKRLQDIGVGFACKKGLKPESPNQDDFFILRVDDWSMYGVFDGHGPYGHDVSAFVHKTLPFLIISDPLFETDLPAALKKAFRKVHHLLEAAAEQPDSMFDCALSGSTGSVVVQRDGKIYVAHVGDSRIVMAQTTSELELSPTQTCPASIKPYP
ncbi:MAG: uncharacterized protein KVP18_001647 [Porospora cf. gigantea A]|uniref:uncharacterized protein n=1 Tax=Porospora cf. gigantea A TaxID=2853593 RepID=UPI003559F582|nr:MAG: hypothetical protein KVP18_001647 [Porospora cf. gigantea A]